MEVYMSWRIYKIPPVVYVCVARPSKRAQFFLPTHVEHRVDVLSKVGSVVG